MKGIVKLRSQSKPKKPNLRAEIPLKPDRLQESNTQIFTQVQDKKKKQKECTKHERKNMVDLHYRFFHGKDHLWQQIISFCEHEMQCDYSDHWKRTWKNVIRTLVTNYFGRS